ncbi:mercuric transport protein MerTP [Mucilaginibacter sp. L3T2-6]|uniref:mercuric transport protein MerTP n=1 Tax=Mucilaginibacter sp. L3T2-6 TaxID=3062491 RepID=UPI00267627BA|nr:mercuric transport protein MerTP [Mucilaginibacter sp. L3T2-6]MDO3641486.1 mercuric transport protein MerTP [Mucilaginibacter sp. L3T2-6]MDV6213753.1 mercuric transport protein MerTP [Mucilaginibacter sp. L3T2-6]
MMSTNINKGWMPGLIAAFAASLCCITPVIALLGGISGIASSFSWIEPARPYLIGFTVVIFAFAWYQQFNKKTQTNNCDCEVKPASFWQSKKFLLMVTALSAVLITFPYYSSALYGAPAQSSVSISQASNIKWVQFTVKGMGCADCTKHIDGVLSNVPGVIKTSTSFEKAQTTVSYDPKRTSADSLKNKINQIGYRATITPIK